MAQQADDWTIDGVDCSPLRNIIERHLQGLNKRYQHIAKVVSSNELLMEQNQDCLQEHGALLKDLCNVREMAYLLRDMISIEANFNQIFAKVKGAQRAARNKHAPNIGKYERKGKPRSQFSHELPEKVDLFRDLISTVWGECENANVDIADSSGVSYKRLPRLFYKGLYVYAQNQNMRSEQDVQRAMGHVTDMIRCSLAFDTFEDLYKCFTVIEGVTQKSGGILRCKDRFNAGRVEYGYRDVLINVYCPQTRFVCEIQLHHIDFYSNKHESHEMYKKARLFDTANGRNEAYKMASRAKNYN